MEAALLHSSANGQSSSSCKRVRNPKRSTQTNCLIQSRTNSGNLYFENFPQMEMMGNGGVFLNPPFPDLSTLPRLNSSPYPLQFHQPPLLPLPMAAASSSSSRRFRSLPTCGGGGGGGSRGSSVSPTHKKQNKGNKDQTNIKPPKQATTSSRKMANASNDKQYPAEKSDLTVGNTKRLGPDPKSLPKDVAKVLFGDDAAIASITINQEGVEKFSGSAFPLAPPPSSLPMPKFSLKPKLSCKAEAASASSGRIDSGATDNLCRLLKLR